MPSDLYLQKQRTLFYFKDFTDYKALPMDPVNCFEKEGHHCQSRFFRCPRRRPFRLVRWETQKEKGGRCPQIFQSGAEFHVRQTQKLFRLQRQTRFLPFPQGRLRSPIPQHRRPRNRKRCSPFSSPTTLRNGLPSKSRRLNSVHIRNTNA